MFDLVGVHRASHGCLDGIALGDKQLALLGARPVRSRHLKVERMRMNLPIYKQKAMPEEGLEPPTRGLYDRARSVPLRPVGSVISP